MSHYIYSTIGTDMAYTIYAENRNTDIAIAEKVVYIKGGAGVAEARNLVTPRGVMTEVTTEELEALQKCFLFNMHLEGGYLSIDSKKVDPDKKANDMNEKDETRQITPDDFKEQKDGTKRLIRGAK